MAVIAPKTRGRGLRRELCPVPRIKIIIKIITIYYLYRVSGSYSIENHRERGLGRGLAPSPRKKYNSNYNNILLAF